MKKTVVWASAVTLFIAALAYAGVPQAINYQGYLTTAGGTPATGPASMVFSLYSSNPARSNPVWRETQPGVSLANGIYSTKLGSVTPINASFNVPYFLGVKVGGDPEMALQPLASVPYAMMAASVAYGNVAVVAKSGGDYNSPVTAMDNLSSWCGVPSGTNTCLLKIMPGVYDIGAGKLVMQAYVDVEGSGENTTVITGIFGSGVFPPAGVVNGASNAELRFLTVLNTGSSGTYHCAISNSNVSLKISHVTANVWGASQMNYTIINDNNSNVTMKNVTATVSNGSLRNFAILNQINSSGVMIDVTANASGGGSQDNNAIGNYYSSSPLMINVIANAPHYGSSSSSGILNVSSSFPILENVTINDPSGSRIVSSGKNIGIGTIYPTVQLEVAGDAKVSGTLFALGGLAADTVKTAAIANGSVTGAKLSLPMLLSGLDNTGPIFTVTNVDNIAVMGDSTSNSGVYGHSRSNYGVSGMADYLSGAGVYGTNLASGSNGYIGGYHGVAGFNAASGQSGVYGQSSHSVGYGVLGNNTNTSAQGLLGAGTTGVVGYAGTAPGSYAGYFYGNVNATGNVTAANFPTPSDLRLKTDIQPLESALDKVLRLRGVSYVMKADESKSRKIGVIAQELELEYPELVLTDSQGMKSVTYANLTAVLIEAVKELKTENAGLKSELAEIRMLLKANRP